MTEHQDNSNEFRFEASMEELEALVSRMESGELSLEESLEAFERGVKLTRRCQQALREAEQKVEILLADETDPQPFESDQAVDD